jgi:uncharacterized protein (TIGR02246 family)
MRTSRICLLGTLAALSFGPAVAQTADSEQAIKVTQSVAETWMKTYDKHDAKAQSMLFVPNGVFLPPTTSVPLVKGRDAIERSWAGLFKSMGGGHETVTVRDAIPIGNDAIAAVNEYKIVGDGANANKVLTGRAAIVLAKTPDGWRYVSITPQAAPPRAAQ